MAKNILHILGHPVQNSLCKALLDAYQTGAKNSDANCKTIIISELNFNPNLSTGYKNREAVLLEDDVLQSQKLIQWADHIVMAYPTWWGSMPALTKGFIDRVFLPGFAFKHHKGKNFPEKLLKGKSIRLLVTMDAPKWWFYLVYRAAQYRMLRDLIFGYVGFDPVRFSTFGAVRTSTEKQRMKWISKTEQLGKQLK
ncbi:MAG: NAD(P)H-dependent oxidoreductase [Cyclobacteriaceae bacterium]|nr:NAD(P)H-dependent oxidoreductase [Cyclobacteriaceae bacterium]